MIYLASDHRGVDLKEKIKPWLEEWGYKYEDLGPNTLNPEDDYPDFVHLAAAKVSESPAENKAIILGASGQGEAMVANRYRGVRAAVFYGPPYQFKAMGWRKWLLMADAGSGVFQTEELLKLLELVRLSREHNDANILSLGASFIHQKIVKNIIKVWLETPFSGDERHVRRIAKIDRTT